MKIRLLDGAGYCGMQKLKFPIEVEARNKGYGYDVSEDELRRIGVPAGEMVDKEDPWWPFPFNSAEAV